MGIFKAYDIRGLVPSELDADLARSIGYHFAELLDARRLVVGQDMRTHSGELADAVSEGMRDAGCDVIRLGLASTPMTYFSIGTLDCDGGLCVTASHNPGEYNGMKLCREGARPVSRDTGIAELEERCAAPYPGPGPKRGQEESADMLDAYAAHVARFASVTRPLHVVVDASNGMGGHTLPAILERIPNVTVERLFFDLDGTFPNHEANPLKEENLRFTQEKVRETGADFGVCLDGDADRCCFVDETGRTVGADLMTALFAPEFLARFPGTGVIYDLRSSWVVQEEVRKAGGIPVRERVGHSFMKATMREQGIQFGGELSGHFYFGENFVSDSGEIAFATALGHFGKQGADPRSLGAQVEPLRRYHSTGEVNFRVEDKDGMIAQLGERYAAGKVDHLDGITVEFGGVDDPEWWWFNVRASNTEPLLRLNLEASSAELMAQRRDELVGILGDPV